MAEEIKLRVAKASPEDVNQMRDFLSELEELLESDVSTFEIGEFVSKNFDGRCGRHFQRVLFGFDTLVENACDPSLSYLEWKPEIKEALTAANNACTGLACTCQQIDENTIKVNPACAVHGKPASQ